MYIKKVSLRLIIVAIIATFLWIPSTDLTNRFYDQITIVNLIFAAAVIFYYFDKNGFRIKERLHGWMLIYISTTLVTSLISERSITKAIIMLSISMTYLAMFLLFEVMIKRNKEVTIRTVWVILTLYSILNYLQFMKKGISNYKWISITYFNGGKFDVGYVCMIWVCLSLYILNMGEKTFIKKCLALVSMIFSIFMVYSMDGMTLAFALTFIAVMYLVFGSFLRKAKVIPMYILFLGSAVIIFFLEDILRSTIVTTFIVNILERSNNLSGRLGIYANMMEVALHNPLLGVGRTGTYIGDALGGYGNAQNGLFQIVYQYGVLGAVCFAATIWEYLKKVCSVKDKFKSVTIIVWLAFVICSVVEITFAQFFMFFTAFSYAIAINSKEEKEIK